MKDFYQVRVVHGKVLQPEDRHRQHQADSSICSSPDALWSLHRNPESDPELATGPEKLPSTGRNPEQAQADAYAGPLRLSSIQPGQLGQEKDFKVSSGLSVKKEEASPVM